MLTVLQKVRDWGLKQLDLIVHKAKRITLPFFDKVPLYDVALFFWKGIVDGAITTRASAIAFNFILAVFPTIIFLFTLIPYIPIDNFQTQLMELLHLSSLPTAWYRSSLPSTIPSMRLKHGIS
jgi:membrane protein